MLSDTWKSCIVIGSMCSINFNITFRLHLIRGHGSVVSIEMSFTDLIQEFIKANIFKEIEISEQILNTVSPAFSNPLRKIWDELWISLLLVCLCDIMNVRSGQCYISFLISQCQTFNKEHSHVFFFATFTFKWHLQKSKFLEVLSRLLTMSCLDLYPCIMSPWIPWYDEWVKCLRNLF
jgi:hypothetical protein